MASNETVSLIRAAALAGDDSSARSSLSKLLNYSTDYGWKFTGKKATRAENFRIDGDRVLFDIYRHPGLSFLEHTVQTWAILPNGSLNKVDEKLELLTVATVRRWNAEQRESGTSCCGYIAQAVGYANQTIRDGEEDWNEAFCLGWVALSLPANGRWRGRIDDLVASRLFDNGNGSMKRKELTELARELNGRAREIWKLVKEP